MWKWVLAVAVFIGLVVLGIYIEQPSGSISGQIYLQSEALSGGGGRYDVTHIKSADTRVIAYGPVTRGSYVRSDGSYRIDNLPVGAYSVRVRANGYSSDTVWNINVKEAVTAKVRDVQLSYLSPSLSISSDTRVFTLNEKPYLWLNGTAVKNVSLELYKFYPERVLNLKGDQQEQILGFIQNNYYYGSDDFDKLLIKDKDPVQVWKKDIVYGQEDYGTATFKTPEKLPAGNYLIRAVATADRDDTKLSDIYWFSVSNLGIVIKQDPYKVLVRAVDLETLKGMKDVDLQVYNRSGNLKLAGQGKTNNEGISEVKLNKDSDENSLLIMGKRGDEFALVGSYSWIYSYGKYRVYTYTDRPIYRPKQTVYFKGIVREVDDTGLKNYAGKKVSVKILGSDDDVIKTFNYTTNSFGSYSGLVEIPEDAKLGDYRVETTINDQDYSAYFEVAEYRKPEYKVDVIPGSKIIVGGKQATATVRANYFFGYPVRNAKVKYTIYASPDYSLRWKLLPGDDHDPFYDDWADEEDNFAAMDYSYGSSSGEIIAEGYAVTDDNGEARVTFDTKKISTTKDNFYGWDASMAQDYKVEAEVTDISRKTALGTGHFNVVSGDYAVFLDTDYRVYTTDKDITVNVTAIDYDKKPVEGANVKLELQYWEWDSTNYEYKYAKAVSHTSVDTGKDGKAVAKLEIPANSYTQYYRIVATSKDKTLNEISSTDYVWIANYDRQFAKTEVQPTMQMTLDKKVYQPGDTAKIMVVSPVKDTKALVSIEGARLFNYNLVDITSNAQMLEIPLDDKFIPNGYVSVTLVGKDKQFFTETRMVKVSPKNNFLSLSIKPDKTKFKPQDTVNYTIKAVDPSGKPVEAELSFGVVDESIYSVREDFTQDIRKFFYREKSNQVETTYSFMKTYSGGPDKIEPRVRKDFKDTAFWRADLKTNKDGIAKVSFKVPDNLTTWRTTVRAVTKDTKVASGIDKILVTKDIIIRLALPRFYTLGDEAILATIVHNYTDTPQKMKVRLRLPENLALIGNAKTPETFITIQPQGQERQDWNIEAVKAGKSKVEAAALSSEIEGDALQQEIETIPYGILKVDLARGRVEQDNETKNIEQKIAEKITPGSLKWVVRLAPSNASMLLGSLDYLVDYPYGCTEQTMSKFLPSIVAGKVAKDSGVSLSPETQEKLPAVVKESLKILYDSQHDDGGWGWWKNDTSTPYMTAYVLYGLKYAKDAGYNIESWRINQALSWLTTYMNSKETLELSKNLGRVTGGKQQPLYYNTEKVTNLCYASYVYALSGKSNQKVLDNLYGNQNELTNEAISNLAMAYAELGNTQRASALVDNLLNRADLSLSIIGFGMTDTLLKSLGITLPPMYSYNSVEVTAIALRALLKVRPDDPYIDNIVAYISANRNGSYWYNTKTTSQVILALSDYIKTSSYRQDVDYDVVVRIGNEELANIHFDKSNMFAPETAIEIPAKLVSEVNNLVIEKNGPGKLYYSSQINYYQYYEPDEIIAPVADKGIVINKGLYRIKSRTDKEGNITYDEIPLEGSAKAGEMILVKLKVKIKQDGQYLMMEDPKSSGMELISTDPRSVMGSSEEEQSDWSYWWDFWWNHQEDRDEKMAFFITFLKAGTYDINYIVRPELPGTYLINPARMTGMYSEALTGSSRSIKLKVEE